jgi:kinesin family member 6/9
LLPEGGNQNDMTGD